MPCRYVAGREKSLSQYIFSNSKTVTVRPMGVLCPCLCQCLCLCLCLCLCQCPRIAAPAPVPVPVLVRAPPMHAIGATTHATATAALLPGHHAATCATRLRNRAVWVGVRVWVGMGVGVGVGVGVVAPPGLDRMQPHHRVLAERFAR